VKEKVMKKMKSLLLVLGMIIIAGSNVRAEKKILKDRSDISLVTPSTWTESKLFEEKVEYLDYSNGKDPNHVIVKFYEDMIPVNKEYKELVGNGLFNRKLYNSKNVNTFQMKYIPQFRVGQFAKIPSEQIRFNECFISERVIDFDKASVSVSFTIQSINP